MLRLVRYSILSQKAKIDQELADTHRKNFTGLPIPGAAGAAVSANLFLFSDEFREWFSISAATHAWIMIVVMVMLGYFMISRWKFPSLKTLHIRVSSFRIVIITVISAVLLVYGLLNHFAIAFVLCSWAYIAVAGILSLIRLISGRKSKTLEEFEPESNDDLDEA